MTSGPPRLPWLGLLLLKVTRLGPHRADVEADLTDLFESRRATLGWGRATLRLVADLVSVWRWPLRQWLRDLASDFKQGLRMMRRGPIFTVTAAVVLSLGIGVNTALFSGIAGLFFKPLPVADPDRLFYLYTKNHVGQVMATVDPQFFAVFSERGAALADFTGHWRVNMGVTADDLTEPAYGEWVAGNYFDLLGVKAAVGRTLDDGDDDLATPGMAVVISHDMWMRRFGGRPDIVGTPVRVHTSHGAIVGVAEPGFDGLTDPWTPSRFWAPGIKMQSATLGGRDPGYRRYVGGPIGQLRPGVSFEQYQAFFNSIVPEWTTARIDRARAYARTPADFERTRRTFEATSYPLYRATDVRMPFHPDGQVIPVGLLAGMVTVVALVLLIAASNIAGLLLARGVARTGEVAVRRALGAGVGRLSRQLLTESVVLAAAGGGLGLFVAYTLVGLFRAYTPSRFAVDISLDWRVLLFAVCVCVGAGVLVGLAPALQAARVNMLDALGNGIGGTRRVRARLRHWIVIPQVALTMVLLLVAAVHTRTLLQIERADPGYRTDDAIVLTVGRWEPSPVPGRNTQADESADAAKVRRFNRDLLSRVGQVPQVRAFALTSTLPVSESFGDLQSVATYQDYVSGAPPRGSAQRVLISDGYLDAVGMRLRAGRMFDERDGHYEGFGVRVALVSEALARAVWPAGNAVGQTFTLQSDSPGQKIEWLEVVGVVNDVEPVFNKDGHRSSVYVPVKQQWRGDARFLIVRGVGDVDALVRDVKAAVLGVESFAEVSQVRTMEQVVGEILYPRRLAAAMLAAGALIGLVLSCIGLYGVVSYSVAQRQREIGIRTTLGAEQGDIVALVLWEGAKVAAIGTAVGFLAAVLVLRATAGLLPNLPKTDLLSFIVVPAILATIVVVACLAPAWRAARVDPARVLRA